MPRRHRALPLPVLLLLALPLGCDLELEALPIDEASEDAEFRFAAVSHVTDFTSGKRLNTSHSGTFFFSELHLGKLIHEGTRVAGVYYDVDPHPNYEDYVEVDTATIDVIHGELEASLSTLGWTIHHHDFKDTLWVVETYAQDPYGNPLWQTGTIELTIEVVDSPPRYVFYTEVAGDPEGSQYELCPLKNGVGDELETEAVVFRGLNVDETPSPTRGTMHQDEDLLYIGCTAGAVGKTAMWGYHLHNLQAAYGQWEGMRRFEAAVRMVRADFCADGTSHTQPGTPVMVDDKMGINDDIPLLTPVGQYPINEAVWGYDGAICLDTPRVAPGPLGIACQNGAVVTHCANGGYSEYNDPWLGALFRTATEPPSPPPLVVYP